MQAYATSLYLTVAPFLPLNNLLLCSPTMAVTVVSSPTIIVITLCSCPSPVPCLLQKLILKSVRAFSLQSLLNWGIIFCLERGIGIQEGQSRWHVACSVLNVLDMLSEYWLHLYLAWYFKLLFCLPFSSQRPGFLTELGGEKQQQQKPGKSHSNLSL